MNVERLDTIKAGAVLGKHGEIVDLVRGAVDAGDDPNRIINEVLMQRWMWWVKNSPATRSSFRICWRWPSP